MDQSLQKLVDQYQRFKTADIRPEERQRLRGQIEARIADMTTVEQTAWHNLTGGLWETKGEYEADAKAEAAATEQAIRNAVNHCELTSDDIAHLPSNWREIAAKMRVDDFDANAVDRAEAAATEAANNLESKRCADDDQQRQHITSRTKDHLGLSL